jgi:hypothetical protein
VKMTAKQNKIYNAFQLAVAANPYEMNYDGDFGDLEEIFSKTLTTKQKASYKACVEVGMELCGDEPSVIDFLTGDISDELRKELRRKRIAVLPLHPAHPVLIALAEEACIYG